MPRVILFGDGETITLLNESGNPDAIIRSIQSGLWRPKLPDPTGPYQAIYNGDTIIVTRRLLESRKKSDVRLSPHELIVVQGMADGMIDQQIAMVYGMKLRMVRFFVTKVKEKLNAATREQVVARAVSLGLIEVQMN
jgi:DNA-binding CsgD family transcriptional regulator